MDRIRATYAADCVIHTSAGTTRGLGFARSVSTGATSFGPATNAPLARHFVADCVSRNT